MKKFLLGTVGFIALGLTMPANAADLRPYTKAPAMATPLAYDWSGFYLGANVGGGWSRKCGDVVDPTTGALLPEGCNNASGGIAGGQVGYRLQSGAWVFGLEAQGDWSDLTGANLSQQFINVPGDATFNSRVRALGMFTGQIGYGWGNALLYVKGGAAVADDRYEHRFVVSNAFFDGAHETRWGSVVGVGLDYGFTPNWSVGVEYDHMFMGSRNVNFYVPGGLLSTIDRINQDVDLVTVRLNYRFGGPVAARY